MIRSSPSLRNIRPCVLEPFFTRRPVLDGQDRDKFNRIAQIVHARHPQAQIFTNWRRQRRLGDFVRVALRYRAATPCPSRNRDGTA